MENPENQKSFLNGNQPNILNIVSSDGHNLDLDVEEKFFAFKSWVQGISDAGLDALYLQDQIDKSLRGSLPIVQFLFKNMIRVDIAYLFQFLNKIEKECRFEGVYHEVSLRANLLIILNVISQLDLFNDGRRGMVPLPDCMKSGLIDCLHMISYLDKNIMQINHSERLSIGDGRDSLGKFMKLNNI